MNTVDLLFSGDNFNQEYNLGEGEVCLPLALCERFLNHEKIQNLNEYIKPGASPLGKRGLLFLAITKSRVSGKEIDEKLRQVALTMNSGNIIEHLNNSISFLREFVEFGKTETKQFGEVMTPLTLVEEMLDTLPKDVWSNPTLKWFDPANGTGPYPFCVIKRLMDGLETVIPDEKERYRHIIEEMIYVSELQMTNMFLYMVLVDPQDIYKLNIYTGSFLDQDFDSHMKNVWELNNFDIIIGNPPYNQMLDLDFLQKSYKLSNIVIFVQPSTYLIDQKCKQKKFVETKKLISKHLESIKLFNGNALFKIALFVPCSITYINKDKVGTKIKCVDTVRNIHIEYDNIFDINKYSSYFFINLKNKILSKIVDNVWNHKNDTPKEYIISFTGIRGNVSTLSNETMIKDDFHTIVSKERNVQTINDDIKKTFLKFYFDDEKSAINFLSYLKTNFCRFCISIYKNNQHLDRGELDAIPYIDFTKEWSDSDLYKYFNLTQEEIDFININIPKYY